jgi:aspartate racemase
VLLDINCKLPSRGRHLQLGETDPSEAIAATIEELARQGATLAVVVCNTAHILFERWARNSSIPVLHIIEETTLRAIELKAGIVAPLVSAALADHDLYGQQAQARGLSCVRPEAADQSIVNELIAFIKVSGGLDTARTQAARLLLERLQARGVDTIIAGCTELSVLDAICSDLSLRFVDSNVALARSALRRLGLPAERLL